jgi:hypothetical protein
MSEEAEEFNSNFLENNDTENKEDIISKSNGSF